MRIIRNLTLLICTLVSTSTLAFDSFRIGSVRVEGLQRISVGTVYSYLPVKQGDILTPQSSSASLRDLYQTGFFRDVVLERDGDQLVVFVEEHPAIATIKFSGNEDIPTDELKANLKQIGFSEGRVFNPSTLDTIQQELNRTYLAMGKYNVDVLARTTPLERNRVALSIEIEEGEVSTIKELSIIGNSAFDEEELLDLFELGTEPFFSEFSTQDQYSRIKLQGDLERLRAFYMDRGYINFAVTSTEVTISPNREQVFISITIHEGEAYEVSKVKLAGNLLLPEDDLLALITVKEGETFSRKELLASNEALTERFGDIGYAFANINPIPDVDSKTLKVDLTFYVDPGRRIYVNRININGNLKTQDEILRREIRQMEGGWISTAKVKLSRDRLNRLGYFEDVAVETPVSGGSPDTVDLNVDVAERSTFGSLNFGIGYGDSQGLLMNASVKEENFLGSGNRFSLSFDNSKVNTLYSLNVTEPYLTLDGVSRGYNLFYRTTDAGEAGVVDYTTDAYGGGINFGIPLNEFDTARFGFDYEYTRINTTAYTSTRITDFINGSGDTFDAYKATVSWTHDTRNRAIFPSDGGILILSSTLAVPAADSAVEFYKLGLKDRHFWELTDRYTFSTKLQIDYANVYGSTPQLPPFEKYYAGGVTTLRGYRANSLGPSDTNGDPLGGNLRTVGNVELVFPPPFAEDSSSVRMSLFLEGGNVFDTDQIIAAPELRYASGVSLVWLSPMGALSFSLAKPIKNQAGDRTEKFQFTLGSPY